MIGVELRTPGRFSSMFEDGSAHLHTSRILVKILGGCPFHGRVERDEIPTRESPPKQSGTR